MGLSVNDVTGIGAVADLAKTVVQTIWPDKTEQEKAQLAASLALLRLPLPGIAAAGGIAFAAVSASWRDNLPRLPFVTPS